MAVAVEPTPTPYIQRQTLCMGGSVQGIATHAGEDDFAQRLQKSFQADESNVAEQLVLFKVELQKLDGEAFWSTLMKGMTEIARSQFGFVSKRVLFDDQRTAVEMPKIGEEGSCLMGTAFYYNNDHGIEGMLNDYKYHAWSCPCSHMKHDKVFIVPEGLAEFIGSYNPNKLAFECDAYIGIPLFANGKCFAHFGTMWTKEGNAKKAGLSWSFIEMFLHSLEDMIREKLIAGQSFDKPVEAEPAESGRFIPQEAVTATQSLKVYARSLSHELRTPMQGVVGMLDLMYATVQEQIEGQNNSAITKIFQSLKSNIEVVQDSSKRAIEAADNVVQAYDLDMRVPDTPSESSNTPLGAHQNSYFDNRHPTMTEGSQIVNPQKRKRESTFDSSDGHNKFRKTDLSGNQRQRTPCSTCTGALESQNVSPRRTSPTLTTTYAAPTKIEIPVPRSLPFSPSNFDTAQSTPGFRQCNIRDSITFIIHDSLRSGGRPDYSVTKPTDDGETIEVKSRSSNGEASHKFITWRVDDDVPEYAAVDERDLAKLFGAVFMNALKFTDEGDVRVHASLSDSKRTLLINISDTGTGIPETFKPELFKAFSKEDVSITRTTEGLGLGLLVAKGLVRRLGGDLNLLRSSTTGVEKGSEFEIRLPLIAGDITSRSNTPFRGNTEEIPRSAPTNGSPRSLRLSPQTPTRQESPLAPSSPIRVNLATNATDRQVSDPDTETSASEKPPVQRRVTAMPKPSKPDRHLAQKYPLTFLVAEDNKINRKLLVQMLGTLGYKDVHEAYDGKEAVRIVKKLVGDRAAKKRRGSSIQTSSAVDVILMDLWMPELDGYQATEQIFEMYNQQELMESDMSGVMPDVPPTVLAVSADVTDAAIDKASKIGMAGYMSKPFKVLDLQKLIVEFCAPRHVQQVK